MENNRPGRYFRPIALTFVVTSVFFATAGGWLAARNIDPIVLLAGNTILFLATVISFYLYAKTLGNKNVQVFLRMMYASLLIKMMLCLAATLLYLFLVGGKVSKGAIFGSFVLYIIYTGLEVGILMRLIRNLPKNA